MKKESLKSKPPFRKNNRLLNASLSTFDLPTLIEKMKHKPAWANGELNSMVLLKTPAKQIVLAVLIEGTEIDSFQSNDSITFQIMEGKIKFRAKKESLTLSKGQLLTLHDNIHYSLTTKEESVLLLTIANGILEPAEC